MQYLVMQNVDNQYIVAGGGRADKPLRQNELGDGCEVYTQREDIENGMLQQGKGFGGKVEFEVCEGTESGWFLIIRSVSFFFSHTNAPGISRKSKGEVFVRRRQWSGVPLNFEGVDFRICA